MAHVERYKLRDGTRRYRVRWSNADGRTSSKSFVRSKDAQRFQVEVERRAALGDLWEAAPERFGEFFEGWLARYKARVRVSTYDRCVDLLPHLQEFFPFPLSVLSRGVVEDYVSTVARTAPRQAELVLRTLKMVLRDAKERGQKVNESIFTIKPPRTEAVEMQFLSWPELDKLAVNTIEPYGNLLRVAALTGLRQGELFGLRASAIDFDGGTLAVTHTLTKRGEFEQPKTRASRRRVDLSQHAQKLLREQLLARVPNDLDLVFPSPEGRPLNADNFRHRVFRAACERSGLDGLRFHDLRHTYAALMVRAGAHPKYLQAQMGHSSIKVTLDRYGHLLPDENRIVLTALDGLVQHRVV